MKTETIDRKARVWTVTVGADGKLHAEIDPRRLPRIEAGTSKLAA